MDKPEKKIDHTKISVTPVYEKNPHNPNDWTVGAKVRIPIDTVKQWFKKLFGKA